MKHLLVLSLLAISPAIQADTLVEPASVETTFSDNYIFIPISIFDVTDLEEVTFNVSWDPTMLTANPPVGPAIEEGTFLGLGFWEYGTINNTAGTITNVQYGINPVSGTPVSGSGLLATLYLTALTPGTSEVTLSNVHLYGPNGAIPFTTAPGVITVDVAPVPEPTLLWPLGALLCGVLLLRLAPRRLLRT